MKSRIILNLLLVLAVTGLALYAILRPAEKTDPGIRLSQLKREDISQIAIERRDAPALRLAKRGNGWHILEPFTARADSTQVDRIIDLLSATAAQTLPREDLARYGLDAPLASVVLNGQAFAFGKINEVTNEQYVATAGAVYPLTPFYGYSIPDSPAKLVSRKLLADDEIPVGFDFGNYRIVRDDKGIWGIHGRMPGKSDMALSQDEFNRWADEWRVTSALSAEPHKGGGGERLKISFRNGSSVDLRILRREPSFQLLRTDENMLYTTGLDAGRRLIDPRAGTGK